VVDVNLKPWGTEIRHFRRLHALKQSALAEIVGVDQGTISRWEKNDSVPSLGMQRRLRDLIRNTDVRDIAFKHSVAASLSEVVLSNAARFFIGASKPFAALHGVPADEIVGRTNHALMDEAGERLWQTAYREGFFTGDIASVTALAYSQSLSGAWRNLPTIAVWIPVRLSSGEIIRRSERMTLTPERYAAALAENGGPLRIVRMDELTD
jgi:transcriptional regulator with XRE-family HTH domain